MPVRAVTRRQVLGGLASGLVLGGASGVTAAGRTFVAVDPPIKFILEHDVVKTGVRRPTSATKVAEHPLDDCRPATFYEYEVTFLAADCGVIFEGASLWVDAPPGELLRSSSVYDLSRITDPRPGCGDPEKRSAEPVLLTASSCGRGRRRSVPNPPRRDDTVP